MKNSDSDSEPDRNIESGSHLDNQPRRKKRFTKKKSDRTKTSSPLQPHAKRNMNLADDNEPNDETQVALNSFSRKRTCHQFEELDSKNIKLEPDRHETDMSYEIRTVGKIEYMSDDSGAANLSDISEVSRTVFPGMITVIEMYY